MNLTRLAARPVEWLQGGPEADVVVSSRVRLARNVEGYPFTNRASTAQKARLEELLRSAVLELAADPPLHYIELKGLDRLGRELLVERRLISAEFAEADWVRGVAFDDAEQTSIMVNEEDHLRIQFVRGGLRLDEAHGRADEIDDLLSERVPFAHSPCYGYLTACPTNVGTGMRASVMLHLAGIVMSQAMDQVLERAQQQRLTVRGVYGEGSLGAGDFYQVSNHVTLGVSEEEIVSLVTDAALKLAEQERTARLNLHNNHRKEFRARVEQALDLLRSASTLSSQEALCFLSQVRMGVEMDILPGLPLKTLNELFLLTLPAHLQTMEGEVLDSSVTNEVRASYVKERLGTG